MLVAMNRLRSKMDEIECPCCHSTYMYEWLENQDDVFYEEECPECGNFFEVAIETEVIVRIFKFRKVENENENRY